MIRTTIRLVMVSLLFYSLVACSKDTTSKTEGLACQQDYSCSDGESCYDGKCTKNADIPKDDAGTVAEKKITPEKSQTPEKTQETKILPEKTIVKDTPKQQETYPPKPYGADVDDVMIPMKVADCNGKVFDLKSLYKHPTIKVIQLTVHTGW